MLQTFVPQTHHVLYLHTLSAETRGGNLLLFGVEIYSYNDDVRLLSPEPWLVSTTEAYSGVGADIVMESISLIDPVLGVLSAIRLLVTARYFSSSRRNLITHDTNYIVCDFGDVAEQWHHRGMNGASMVSHG
jgi:hypothetical protein